MILNQWNVRGRLAAMAAVGAAAAFGSVFDDARLWWKFDNGGADGAVVQKSEIHDARDPSAAVPTAVYGAQGGPLWSRMDVRLPTQRKTVNCTALYAPCETRYTTTNQCFQASLEFGNIQVDSKDITVVARVMHDGNAVSSADCVLFNNGYNWTDYISQAFGFIKASSTRGPATLFYPYAFLARTYPGGSSGDKRLAMSVGQWYDVAYSLRLGEDGTNYLTFVVSGDKGLNQQTVAVASNYASGPAKTTTRLPGMARHTGWTNYSPSLSQNTGDAYKHFSGWVHQLAVWDRALTVDEIKEAFGTAEPSAADPYADAVHWWRFDRDINGDGLVQTNEVRDVRFWGGTNANAYGRAHLVPTAKNGPFGGPLWQDADVYLPGTSARNQSSARSMLPLTGGAPASIICPPSASDFSRIVTSWPRRFAMIANCIPASPPPATMIFFGSAASATPLSVRRSSNPRYGLIAQRMELL